MKTLHHRVSGISVPGLSLQGIPVVGVFEILPEGAKDAPTAAVGGVLGKQEVEIAGVVVALPAAAGALEGTGALMPDEGFAKDAPQRKPPRDGRGGRSRIPRESGRNARR